MMKPLSAHICSHQWWQKSAPYQLLFPHNKEARNEACYIYIDDNNEPFISFHLLTPMMTDVRPASALSSGHINEARTEPIISSHLLTKMQKMRPLSAPICSHQWSLKWGLYLLTQKRCKKWSPHQLSPVHTNEAQNETLMASLIHSCQWNQSMTTGVPEIIKTWQPWRSLQDEEVDEPTKMLPCSQCQDPPGPWIHSPEKSSNRSNWLDSEMIKPKIKTNTLLSKHNHWKWSTGWLTSTSPWSMT